MAPGEYEFVTSMAEIMTVTSGKLTVRLPGSEEWKVEHALGALLQRAEQLVSSSEGR